MVNIIKTPEDQVKLRTIDKSARTVDGEILEFRPDCPFRSISDLKAYDDSERNSNSSETDVTQYEPLESIIARCQRGELVFDANQGWYEFDGDSKPEDLDAALDAVSPEEDLTDIDVMAENLAAGLNQNKTATQVASKSEASTQDASEVPSAPNQEVD